MREVRPASEPDVCDALRAAVQAHEEIALGGAFSKRRMSAGPASPAVAVSLACMRRVLQYEPRDLTISVEAGLPFAGLSALLAEHRQMIPLDPPCFDQATVGGVAAANSTGPRRRLYGTARDVVIGVTFVKPDGKVAKSGGMVVKNVAGFDLAKLMIGSFGTLAAITVVNFKLAPMPPETRTFVLQFATARECAATRDSILQGVLQPAAVDALNPAAAKRAGLEGFALLLQAGGSASVIARYARELDAARQLDGEAERRLWTAIREFTPEFVGAHAAAHVVRVSGTLSQMGAVLESTEAPVVARAGSGVCTIHFENAADAAAWISRPEVSKWRYVFEYGAPAWNGVFGAEFEMMKAVKNLFDPERLLNPGRLYGRL